MTFAPIDAEYLTLAANGVLTDYRILTLGSMLVAVDGGPAAPYTLNVDPAAVPHNSLDQLTTGDPHTQYLLGTILAANGDLLTRVAGSPAALSPGTDDQVLTIVGGLPAWQTPTPSADGGPTVPIISGRYYTMPATGGTTTTNAITANRMYFNPVYVPNSHAFDRIAVEVTTFAAGNIRLGIYGPFTGSFAALPLVVDGGTVSVGTNGLKTVTINVTLAPGWYFLAAVCDVTPTLRAYSSAIATGAVGRTTIDNTGQDTRIFYAFTYGTLPSPSTTTPTFDTSTGPIIALRAT